MVMGEAMVMLRQQKQYWLRLGKALVMVKHENLDLEIKTSLTGFLV